MNDAYIDLAKHLDDLPAGFPATDSGVEMRILKRLFTPQEAAIAVGLTMMPEPASAIAERLDMDEPGLSPILERMAKKGLIFSRHKDGQDQYMAAQFIIGIWEYHVNNLDKDLIKDVNEYLPYFMKLSWTKQKTKQLRVIPLSKSISAEMNIMPYEQAEEIIQKQSKIVIAPCICRKEHAMMDKGCNRLLEGCLIFGSGAYYYEKNHLGRSISHEEALRILKTGIEDGLVLQPGNSQKPANICMCCGCCCQILKNLKAYEKPAKIVCSNYYAVINEDDCTACGTCEDRCQVDAITVDEDTAHIDNGRCIGCGLCVVSCDFDAIHMQEKDQAERWIPPENTFKTYLNIAKERGKI
ncbi:MAG: 4Fe-4S binding protein [Desulfobacterales bacterium]|nr:MAG: 4Fe-4S binding protein [Desulfobacterales bacterium]